MNGNGLDVLPTVSEKMLHYQFSSCSKGKQTLGCPYGSTGQWVVYCDNAQVKASGSCTSTECNVHEIHAAMTGGTYQYPIGSGRVYPTVTHTMYHYEFPKLSPGKEKISCPDRSSGEWEVYCDNGEVKASGQCDVTSFYGYMPYQTNTVSGPITSERDGKCLDYNFNNGNVYMHSCHGGSNQQWYFDDRGQMHSVRDGKCLDQHMENNNVYMHNCHGDRNQRWHFETDGHIGTAFDDKCLDYNWNDHNVYMHSCHGDSNQRWIHPQRDLNKQAAR
jgi:hypothetical protein